MGNEAGYVTGMGTCEFPNSEAPIAAGEKVVVESVYSKLGGHTGVMGQFVVGVAVYSDYKAPPEGMCIGPGKKMVSAPIPKVSLQNRLFLCRRCIGLFVLRRMSSLDCLHSSALMS